MAQAARHLLSRVCSSSSTTWVAPGMSLTQSGNIPSSSFLQLDRNLGFQQEGAEFNFGFLQQRPASQVPHKKSGLVSKESNGE